MSCRLYVGRLPRKATENDVERFFRGYGRIRDIELKGDFGFVELQNSRDADDAAYDLNGKELCGSRVIVELARLPGSRSGFPRGRNSRDPRARYGPPERTRNRLVVKNLSSRVSWQDLKDVMRKVGEVTYADAHKMRKNEAIVEFASRSDLKRALDRFDGYEMCGRKLRLVEEGGGASRSPSHRHARKRSRGRGSSDRSPSDKRRRSISGGRRSHSSGNSSRGSRSPSDRSPRRDVPSKSNRRSESISSHDEKSDKEDPRATSVPKFRSGRSSQPSSRGHSSGSDRGVRRRKSLTRSPSHQSSESASKRSKTGSDVIKRRSVSGSRSRSSSRDGSSRERSKSGSSARRHRSSSRDSRSPSHDAAEKYSDHENNGVNED